MADIISRPYSTAAACERCVFGRGQHAKWCEYGIFEEHFRKSLSRAIFIYDHMYGW